MALALAFANPVTFAFMREEDTDDWTSESWEPITDEGGESTLLLAETAEMEDMLACRTLGGGVFTSAVSDDAAVIEVCPSWEDEEAELPIRGEFGTEATFVLERIRDTDSGWGDDLPCLSSRCFVGDAARGVDVPDA